MGTMGIQIIHGNAERYPKFSVYSTGMLFFAFCCYFHFTALGVVDSIRAGNLGQIFVFQFLVVFSGSFFSFSPRSGMMCL